MCYFLEGDRRAYFEGAEWTIKEQKTKISSMRKENKELHKHKHDRLMVGIYSDLFLISKDFFLLLVSNAFENC